MFWTNAAGCECLILGFIVNTLYFCSDLGKNSEQCTAGTVILLVLEMFSVVLPSQARSCHPILNYTMLVPMTYYIP